MNQEQKWFYLDQQHQQHIVSSSKELLELYNGQVIKPQSYVWRNGLEDWERFQKLLPELQAGTLQTLVDTGSSDKELAEDYSQVSADFDEVGSTQINAVENLKKKYSEPYEVTWVSQPHRENNIVLMYDFIHVLNEQKKLEGLRVYPNRVDGQIIGTGEADFTKDNVSYEFTYKDKTFQLVDVPGIEGDESKYEHLVHKAVAKAHLVFYVNGAGKKPEKNTAQKIKSYLNDYAKVYPILNLRGPATSYYADEDSDEPYETLEQAHSGASKLFDETLDVLKESIGEDLIQSGQYMQGLMAFSALAYNPEKKETTIFFGRNHDLGRDQKKFLQLFKDTEKMADFSKIGQLQEYIISKFDTFKQDIVESNKLKISRRVEETVDVLQEELDRHLILQKKIKYELDSSHQIVEGVIQEFKNSLFNKWVGELNKILVAIKEEGTVEIRRNYGNNESIGSNIKSIIDKNQNIFKDRLDSIVISEKKDFMQNLENEIRRLNKNIRSVSRNFLVAELGASDVRKLTINIGDIFNSESIFKNMGDFTVFISLGMAIGSIVPVLGTFLGGFLGAFLAAAKKFGEKFSDDYKEKNIKKQQSKFCQDIDDNKDSLILRLGTGSEEQANTLRQELSKHVYPLLNAEYQKMCDVERILIAEIQTISSLKQRIKEKKYGTV